MLVRYRRWVDRRAHNVGGSRVSESKVERWKNYSRAEGSSITKTKYSEPREREKEVAAAGLNERFISMLDMAGNGKWSSRPTRLVKCK